MSLKGRVCHQGVFHSMHATPQPLRNFGEAALLCPFVFVCKPRRNHDSQARCSHRPFCSAARHRLCDSSKPHGKQDDFDTSCHAALAAALPAASVSAHALASASRVVDTSTKLEEETPASMHSGALKEPPQHNSTSRCRGTPPKARVFLGSIEGAKSAPARPSAGFSRRQAAAADGGNCAMTTDDSAEVGQSGQSAAFVSLSDCGTEVRAHDDAMGGSRHPQHAAESSHEEGPCDASPAAAFANDSATASQCVPTARVYTGAGRSKAAVPLFQYIRANDGTSASSRVLGDAGSQLVYSSHLRPGTSGHGLVADESDAQVKQRKQLKSDDSSAV
jgi:hypothetical protein